MDNNSVFWCTDNQNNNLALIVKANHQVRGIEFLTPNSFGQQLAIMSHPAGHLIDAHTHLPVNRDLVGTQEVIVLRKGSIRIDLYTESHEYVRSVILESGDIALLCGGGHGFEILEDSEFYEVKQGPYTPEKDKVRFEPTHNNRFIGIE